MFRNLRHTDKIFVRSIRIIFEIIFLRKETHIYYQFFMGFFMVIFDRNQKLRFSCGHFRPTNFFLILIDAIYNYMFLLIHVKEGHLNSKYIWWKKYVQKELWMFLISTNQLSIQFNNSSTITLKQEIKTKLKRNSETREDGRTDRVNDPYRPKLCLI